MSTEPTSLKSGSGWQTLRSAFTNFRLTSARSAEDQNGDKNEDPESFDFDPFLWFASAVVVRARAWYIDDQEEKKQALEDLCQAQHVDQAFTGRDLEADEVAFQFCEALYGLRLEGFLSHDLAEDSVRKIHDTLASAGERPTGELACEVGAVTENCRKQIIREAQEKRQEFNELLEQVKEKARELNNLSEREAIQKYLWSLSQEDAKAQKVEQELKGRGIGPEGQEYESVDEKVKK